MKIARIEDLHADAGWRTFSFLKITTDDGLVGWSEYTEAEVLEYTGAFLQLYREEAHYLERTAPWVARVGLAYADVVLSEGPVPGESQLAQLSDAGGLSHTQCGGDVGRNG